jgi:methionyl-tRNA formyltransferase
MRIIFMGSPDFAVPSLDALVEAGHEIACVYTQPPRPAGAERASRRPPCTGAPKSWASKCAARSRSRTRRSRRGSRRSTADLAIVAAYGLILPKPVLEAPRGGCINVHASLLPRWRGAAPIQRAILAGDETTGVTIMRMEEGLDTGPMLLKREPKSTGKTAGELTDELARLGARGAGRVARKSELRRFRSRTRASPMRARSTRPRRGSTGTVPAKRSSARCAPSRPPPAPGSRRWRTDEAARSAGRRGSGKPGEVLDDASPSPAAPAPSGRSKVQRAGRG